MRVFYFETLRRLAPTAEKESRYSVQWVCLLSNKWKLKSEPIAQDVPGYETSFTRVSSAEMVPSLAKQVDKKSLVSIIDLRTNVLWVGKRTRSLARVCKCTNKHSEMKEMKPTKRVFNIVQSCLK